MYLYCLCVGQGLPMTCGWPRQTNNLTSFKNQYFFNFFGLGQPCEHFWGFLPKSQIIFAEIHSHMATWVYYYHIFNFSGNILMPLMCWLPRQLPSWHTPYSGPDCGLNAVVFPINFEMYMRPFCCVFFTLLITPQFLVKFVFSLAAYDLWDYREQVSYTITIQGVSRLVDITAGGDFLGLCDQKSSCKHVSDFGRLRSYGSLKLRGEGNVYWQ